MDDERKWQLLRALVAHARDCNTYDIKRLESLERGMGDPRQVISGYVDYYCGKRINIDFGSVIDPQLYNRYNGDGLYERVLDSLDQ